MHIHHLFLREASIVVTIKRSARLLKYKQITKQYAEQVLKEVFDEEKQVISIITPKQG